ncbi:portal protein [Pseudomonas anguilliseptica]|uniref:portal protein n=1 Tax=Pseudomonas anguilliseptica TaxID=53406 RepID=UPI00325B6218
MSLGLLNFKPASELLAEDEAERRRQDEARRMQAVESSLSGHIQRAFEAAKTAKQQIEARLLDCARRQKGEYDADKLQAIREEGGSELYPKLTTTKCRAAAAWIRDILMPANGSPWGLEPTPVAEIPPDYLAMFAQKLGARAQGMDQQQVEELLRREVQNKARQIADRHEEVIKDQLAEGGWDSALESFIDDFVTYPAAFLRGPLLQRVPELSWMEGWKMVEVDAIKPQFARVSPYDIYPSPDSVDIDDGAYLIERERYNRAHLNRLRGVPGYKDEAIEAVLTEHGRGGLREWLATDSERARLEDRSHDWLTNQGETIEGLHYWGSAQGLMLLQWGMTPEQIEDPLGEYEIDAILIGRHVIRCVINRNPMGERPYHKASFQLVPGSFWGIGIPELMSDIQDMCCAVARAQANNMAFASGPQIEISVDRLMPEENPNEIFPMKRWRTKSDRTGTGAQQPAIRFFQPDSRAGELMQVYSQWEQRADDATNIPRYAYGNEKVGGAGNTMGGLSMLMESANKGIKDAIRHIDRGVTSRVISALWLFNMRYSDDVTIKGDCRAVPRGASAMLLREQTQQARQQFLAGTANDLDMQIVGIEGRARLLRSIADQLDMPGLVPEDDEIKSRIEEQGKQQAQQQEQQMQLEAGKAQAEAAQKQAAAGKSEAETQRIMLEIQALLGQLQQMGGLNGAVGGGVPGAGQVGGQQQPGLASPQGPVGTLPGV